MIPYEERTPDYQYQNALRQILAFGRKMKKTIQGPSARRLAGVMMRYDLKNGAPLITERKCSFYHQAIGEIFAFINGVRTQKGLEEFGCRWWKDWVTPEKCACFDLPPGDLGPGSYGGAFRDFPTEDGPLNQFAAVVKQIKEKPFLRTHFISPWIPQYIIGKKRQVVVAPCHGWIHFLVTEKVLDLVMWQRSADLPVGVPSNMIQYAALLLAMAQVTGLKPGTFVHQISDAHIYSSKPCDQLPAVEEILERKPRRLPTLRIVDPMICNLFDFRPEHFEIVDYDPWPAIKVPVAI